MEKRLEARAQRKLCKQLLNIELRKRVPYRLFLNDVKVAGRLQRPRKFLEENFAEKII
jgi:hypothetical protein